MVWRVLALGVLVAIGAGCGRDQGLSSSDRRFVEQVVASSQSISEAMSKLTSCGDLECLETRGAVAGKAVGAQLAPVELRLQAVDDDCIRDAGTLFVQAFQTYRDNATEAASRDPAQQATGQAQASLYAMRAQEGLAACLNTPEVSLVISRGQLAIQLAVEQLNRCTDDACFTRQLATFAEVVGQRKRAVDRSLRRAPECVNRGAPAINASFASLVTAVNALAQGDDASANAAIARSDRQLQQGTRAIQLDCLD